MLNPRRKRWAKIEPTVGCYYSCYYCLVVYGMYIIISNQYDCIYYAIIMIIHNEAKISCEKKCYCTDLVVDRERNKHNTLNNSGLVSVRRLRFWADTRPA